MAASASRPPWTWMTSRRSAVDVGGHAFGITANIDVGSFADPAEELLTVLQDSVLDVDLAVLIPAEGGFETGEVSSRLELGEFFLVEEVELAPLVTEEEPVPSRVAGRFGARGGRLEKGRSRFQAQS